jgi:hypothetical protein
MAMMRTILWLLARALGRGAGRAGGRVWRPASIAGEQRLTPLFASFAVEGGQGELSWANPANRVVPSGAVDGRPESGDAVVFTAAGSGDGGANEDGEDSGKAA